MPDRQNGLYETGDTGRAFQVSEIGLHRSDAQRITARALPAESGSECRRFDPVAHARTGSVKFDILNNGGVKAGACACETDDFFLCRLVRHGEPRSAPVVVHRASANDTEDAVPVGEGVGEPLEDDDSAALAADISVGLRVESPALPVGGKSAELLRAFGALGGEGKVDPAGQGEGALSGAQRLGGLVHGDEGGGLAGVDGDAGSAQAKGVGDAVGDDAAGQAGHGVLAEGVRCLTVGEHRVVVPHGAHEHTGRAALETRRSDAGILQRFPRQFQRETLLRVHRGGLTRGNSEETRIEFFDSFQLSGNDGTSILQQLPEFGRTGHAWKTARSTDDGDVIIS
ncbi:hypothetical protein SGLAM104S_06052 [Streptomyces glaucescens]